MHLARTICRRAERRVIALREHPDESVPGELIVYLNRVSDFLFYSPQQFYRSPRDEMAHELG